MSTTAENPNQYSTKHPHEPEIPPALDKEGRCRVCGLLVRIDEAVALLRRGQFLWRIGESDILEIMPDKIDDVERGVGVWTKFRLTLSWEEAATFLAKEAHKEKS